MFYYDHTGQSISSDWIRKKHKQLHASENFSLNGWLLVCVTSLLLPVCFQLFTGLVHFSVHLIKKQKVTVIFGVVRVLYVFVTFYVEEDEAQTDR